MKRRTARDCYEILGVPRDASEREIAKAYRDLVSRYHPDKHQDNELKELAEEKLAELNEAYEILSNPASRAAYDAERRQAGFGASAPHRYENAGAAPFPYIRFIALLAFIAGAFVTVRFVRNPRVGAILGAAIAVLWFGPRIYRYLRSKIK